MMNRRDIVIGIPLFGLSTMTNAHNLKIYEARTLTWSQDLPQSWRQIANQKIEFDCEEVSHITVSGHIRSRHRNLVDGPVMVSFKLQIDNSWMGAGSGGNITGHAQHYFEAHHHGYKLVGPGRHVVELWGRSASSLRDYNGLAECVPNANSLIVRVESA